MRVLVDTSAWIRFLQGREPFLTDVDRLLAQGDVIGHEFVYGELLIGDIGGRSKLLGQYRLLEWSALCGHEDTVDLARRLQLHGRGIGWIDVHLLVAAQRDDIGFLTADQRLNAIAVEMGLTK